MTSVDDNVDGGILRNFMSLRSLKGSNVDCKLLLHISCHIVVHMIYRL